MTDKPTPPPFKSLNVPTIMGYAFGIAMHEAQLDGLLTVEAVDRIALRADNLITALFSGKVVELGKPGTAAVIRDALPTEEAELLADEFPMHHKARTTLDI